MGEKKGWGGGGGTESEILEMGREADKDKGRRET